MDTRSGQEVTGLRLVPKLKFEHIYLSLFSKMRVDLSAETRYGIEVTGRNYQHVCRYMYMSSKWETILSLHLCLLFHTVHSFIELSKYLFTIPGVKVFLSEKLSQDPLEKFFGCQRQRGGTSDDPNVAEFVHNTNSLCLINTVRGNVSRSNCRGNKHLKEENTPLPKRRRYHK